MLCRGRWQMAGRQSHNISRAAAEEEEEDAHQQMGTGARTHSALPAQRYAGWRRVALAVALEGVRGLAANRLRGVGATAVLGRVEAGLLDLLAHAQHAGQLEAAEEEARHAADPGDLDDERNELGAKDGTLRPAGEGAAVVAANFRVHAASGAASPSASSPSSRTHTCPTPATPCTRKLAATTAAPSTAGLRVPSLAPSSSRSSSRSPGSAACLASSSAASS